MPEMTMRSRAWTKRLLAAAAAALAAAASVPAHADDNVGITSGVIKTTTFRVDKGLNAPTVDLHLTGDVQSVFFGWTGPAGKTISQYFGVTTAPGSTTFKGYADTTGVTGIYFDSPASFGQFTASGTWTLSSITICGLNVPCIDYSGTSLAALFPSLTVAVSNPLSDVTPPVFVSGSLQDTEIKASQTLHLTTTVADDVSGAITMSLNFSPTSTGRTISSTIRFTSPVTSQATMKMQIPLGRPKAGTYVISQIQLTDRAANITTITDPATISSLFGGNDSFVVTRN